MNRALFCAVYGTEGAHIYIYLEVYTVLRSFFFACPFFFFFFSRRAKGHPTLATCTTSTSPTTRSTHRWTGGFRRQEAQLRVWGLLAVVGDGGGGSGEGVVFSVLTVLSLQVALDCTLPVLFFNGACVLRCKRFCLPYLSYDYGCRAVFGRGTNGWDWRCSSFCAVLRAESCFVCRCRCCCFSH